MSVLMTAGRKAIQKNQKQQQKKKNKPVAKQQNLSGSGGSGSSHGATPTPPPMSSPLMSVWYWLLDGRETTVIFNKTKNEVWCNGCVMQTFEGFAESEDEDDSAGGIIDFVIFSTQTQTSHAGRIKRLPLMARSSSLSASTNSLEVGSHCLTIDNCFIPEYTDQPVSSSDYGEDYDFDDDDEEDDVVYHQHPPSYDSVTNNHGKRLM